MPRQPCVSDATRVSVKNATTRKVSSFPDWLFLAAAAWWLQVKLKCEFHFSGLILIENRLVKDAMGSHMKLCDHSDWDRAEQKFSYWQIKWIANQYDNQLKRSVNLVTCEHSSHYNFNIFGLWIKKLNMSTPLSALGFPQFFLAVYRTNNSLIKQ